MNVYNNHRCWCSLFIFIWSIFEIVLERKEMQIFCYQRKVSRNQFRYEHLLNSILCFCVMSLTKHLMSNKHWRVEKRKCIFSLVTNFSPPRLSQFGVRTIIWALQRFSLSQHKHQPVAKNTQRKLQQTSNSSRRIGDKQREQALDKDNHCRIWGAHLNKCPYPES